MIGSQYPTVNTEYWLVHEYLVVIHEVSVSECLGLMIERYDLTCYQLVHEMGHGLQV